jgi:bifunctional DNA-binding transcriptional regulator/antitoxin component of YhaV-PrlF toxin-antitoxin module
MSEVIDKKIIPVSSKRQITIPVKFFRSLELDNETKVECLFTGEEIIIRPAQEESGYFSQEILNDLIDEGFSGDDLKREFAKRSRQVRPAVKKMLDDVKTFTKKSLENYKDETDEIFGTED